MPMPDSPTTRDHAGAFAAIEHRPVSADNPPWQPWTPTVGDRVRVALSNECRDLEPLGGAHHEIEDGLTGRVGEWPTVLDRTLVPSHNIFVIYDTSYYVPGYGMASGAAFAASELEPLEPPAEDAGR
jgi:hypothetical protein